MKKAKLTLTNFKSKFGDTVGYSAWWLVLFGMSLLFFAFFIMLALWPSHYIKSYVSVRVHSITPTARQHYPAVRAALYGAILPRQNFYLLYTMLLCLLLAFLQDFTFFLVRICLLLAPRAGFEPTASRLTVIRSADWANNELKNAALLHVNDTKYISVRCHKNIVCFLYLCILSRINRKSVRLVFTNRTLFA